MFHALLRKQIFQHLIGIRAGIADLVGNVWEWTGGLRINDGEIQIIANNDVAAGADMSAASSACG